VSSRRTVLALLQLVVAVSMAMPAMAAPPVRLYYFHRNIRCVTCVALGEITSWVAEVTFKKEIAAGEFGFELVNYQSPGNEHFAADFDLEQPSAVLVASEGDSVTNWHNLDRIWELSENHKELETYLTTEIRDFLAEAEAREPGGK